MTIDKTNGQISLHLNSDVAMVDSSALHSLFDWYEVKEKLNTSEISEEEYMEWKLNYPISVEKLSKRRSC